MTRPRTSDARSCANSPSAFFLLTLALTVPIWLIGSLFPFQLLPGLPLSSLMVICPVSAALILRLREAGTSGARRLLRRAVDVYRIRSLGWAGLAFLLGPVLFLLSYGVMRLLTIPMPLPRPPGIAVVPLLLLLLVSAVAEELGWMAYAFEPLEKRWGAFGAAIVIGGIWAAWHLVPFVQVERSLSWMAWQSMYLLGSRVLIVWIFKNTGRSVFAAALFHAMGNLGWQLFPVQGSHYDPRITGLLVAVLAVGVVAFGGLRRSTRPHSREQSVSVAVRRRGRMPRRSAS